MDITTLPNLHPWLAWILASILAGGAIWMFVSAWRSYQASQVPETVSDQWRREHRHDREGDAA